MITRYVIFVHPGVYKARLFLGPVDVSRIVLHYQYFVSFSVFL